MPCTSWKVIQNESLWSLCWAHDFGWYFMLVMPWTILKTPRGVWWFWKKHVQRQSTKSERPLEEWSSIKDQSTCLCWRMWILNDNDLTLIQGTPNPPCKSQKLSRKRCMKFWDPSWNTRNTCIGNCPSSLITSSVPQVWGESSWFIYPGNPAGHWTIKQTIHAKKKRTWWLNHLSGKKTYVQLK